MCCDSHTIRGAVEITRQPECFGWLSAVVKYKSYRIVGFDVVLNNECDFTFTSAGLKRNVARLEGRLESPRIGLCVLLSQVRNLLTVVLKLSCFLLDHVLLESASTGWCSLRAADLGLLLLTIGSYADLEGLLLFNVALNTCSLLLLPSVMSERRLIGCGSLFDFAKFLL